MAVMLAAIAAYRRDKEQAERMQPVSGRSEDPWTGAGRRAQMRGGLR